MREERPGLRRAPPAEGRPLEPEQRRGGPGAPSGGGEAMLPWKRHKFELLAAAAAAGEEGEAEGGAAAAARRGCPASGAEGALSRVGQLFRRGRRRQKFRVSGEAPSYSVLYLGNAATLQAKGEGCTDAAVGRIWAKSQAGRLGAKMRLTIGPQGLRLVPPAAAAAAESPEGAAAAAAARPPPGHLYLLHRVTYCVADPRLPRLFAWVYRHEGKHKAVLLRCHAVLVSKAQKARAMALLLYQTSAAALAEFRRLKRRADARRQHLQLQQQLQDAAGLDAHAARPLLPLRRLLLLRGPAAAYKPPVERSRSAPRLGSIAEDALGEQLEEEERAHHAGGGCCGQDQDEDDDDEEDEDDVEDELLDGGAAGLGALISGLGQLAIGNDPALLRADLRVTRLLSGESTGSESSLDSADGGPEPDTG